MKIIPAIDLINGQPVRLKQGDFNQVQFYPSTLLELSGELWEAGIRDLHLVNLSAADKPSQSGDYKEIASLLKQYPLRIDYGGGIRSEKQVLDFFSLGVDAVNIGTLIFENPTLFAKLLRDYPTKIIASLDVKDNIIAYKAWKESTNLNLFEFLPEMMDKGLQKLCVTDIYKDGMMAGPALQLYKEIRKIAPALEIIASGGLSSKKDIEDLKAIPCDGAIIGKAWLDRSLNLTDLC